MPHTPSRFSSRFTTILTMAGFAIGLGNVWRFPYMLGQNGGGAFLLVYLVFMLLLAIPAITCEWVLGRHTREGTVGAFRHVFGTQAGTLVGYALLFSVFVALSYYALVVAQVIYSGYFALAHGYSDSTLATYTTQVNDPAVMLGVGAATVILAGGIIMRGLKRGIEAASKLLVPVFAIICVYLVVVALRLPGAVGVLTAYLKPDFSQITSGVLFAAMGQACFTLGLSGSIGIAYGAYLRDEEKLLPTAAATAGMDTAAALLASLFVIPAVLVFGLDMAGGPGLLFDTLPRLFAVMPGGRVLAGAFLIAWSFVCLLSIMAPLEAIVKGLEKNAGLRLSRRNLTLIISAALLVVMAPIAYHPEWIGPLDLIFGSGMFMLGALLAVVGAAWGLERHVLNGQLSGDSRQTNGVIFWLRWIVPLALGAILIGHIISALN
ncbi:MAG: sodium-dependent transporter [Gammaproteobacteria bacterium]